MMKHSTLHSKYSDSGIKVMIFQGVGFVRTLKNHYFLRITRHSLAAHLGKSSSS